MATTGQLLQLCVRVRVFEVFTDSGNDRLSSGAFHAIFSFWGVVFRPTKPMGFSFRFPLKPTKSSNSRKRGPPIRKDVPCLGLFERERELTLQTPRFISPETHIFKFATLVGKLVLAKIWAPNEHPLFINPCLLIWGSFPWFQWGLFTFGGEHPPTNKLALINREST